MVYGITGGIGAGKSTVSVYLKELGYTIVDADLVSRKVVEPGSPALEEIASAFGPEYIDEEGNLKRRELGMLVFSDSTALAKLNIIMNSRIHEEIMRQINESQSKHTFLDAATLIEAGYAEITDKVWIVDADDEVRIKRVIERDGITRQEVLDRMSNQMSREERVAVPSTIIDNSGTIEETRANVRSELKKLDSEEA